MQQAPTSLTGTLLIDPDMGVQKTASVPPAVCTICEFHRNIGAGLPLAVAIARANRQGSMLVESILDRPAPAKCRGRGRLRRRQAGLYADNGRAPLAGPAATSADAGSPPASPRLGWSPVEAVSSDRLGQNLWVVERTFSWLLAFCRLAVRYDRSATTISPVITLVITSICSRRFTRKDHSNHLYDCRLRNRTHGPRLYPPTSKPVRHLILRQSPWTSCTRWRRRAGSCST